MHVHHLTSVDGEIVFDFDPDVVRPAIAGVRLADGLTIDHGAILASRRTKMYATFEIRAAGASIDVRPRLLDSHADTVAALVTELQDLGSEGLGVVPDFGISAADLAPLDAGGQPGRRAGALAPVAAARGVGAAAQAWLGSLEGTTVAVEGFGEVGEHVVRDLQRRGARIVAVSTERGAIADAAGFDVDELADARDAHGPGFVHQVERDVHLPREMHELPVDLLVPGPALGILGPEVAEKVQAGLVVPAGLGTHTDTGLDVLRRLGVTVLPEVVTAAGAALADAAPRGLPEDEILGRVDRLVAERIDSARLSKMDPIEYIDVLADTFAATWIPG